MVSSFFSSDYLSARARFVRAAHAAGFSTSAYPITARGPGGAELTIDVASSGPLDAQRTLLLSSGLHGVEGFLGSAAQLALLEGPFRVLPTTVRVVLVHGLNPWGFAWRRRVNEDNIDLNRNFLLRGQAFEGAPEGYRRLSGLLNPEQPRRLDDLFLLRAAGQLLRTSFGELKAAVAQGQYELPEGLFFGGRAPSETQRILKRELSGWVGRPQRLLHIDLHTGLGPFGEASAWMDRPGRDPRVALVSKELGRPVEPSDRGDVMYQIRGGLGPWLCQELPDTVVDSVLVELGTYPALRVLMALREESRNHRLQPESRFDRASKGALLQAFFPNSRRWRSAALRAAIDVSTRALAVLRER